MKKLTMLCLTTLLPLVVAAGPTRNVEVRWDPPTHYIVGDSCSSQGSPIGSSGLQSLTYQLRWKINNGELVYATTNSTTFVIEGVPSNSTIAVSVGAFLPGGSVKCWTDEVSAFVPPPSAGACGNVKVQVK